MSHQRPFVNYYGPLFILYEISSPLLNIHWFLDKLDMTGSTAQLINGIFLIITFFSCRLVWGTYQSFRVFSDIYRAYQAGAIKPGPGPFGAATPDYHGSAMTGSAEPVSEIMRFAGARDVPVWLAVSYLSANLVLNGLNYYWFGKMIETIRKRFPPPFGTRRDGEEQMQAGKPEIKIERGIYADGTKSIEISATEVRSRRRG